MLKGITVKAAEYVGIVTKGAKTKNNLATKPSTTIPEVVSKVVNKCGTVYCFG